MKFVTVDTNTVDNPRIVEAARRAGFDIARTTVTDREPDGRGAAGYPERYPDRCDTCYMEVILSTAVRAEIQHA